jgi:predicted PurR-regulated permease PerM
MALPIRDQVKYWGAAAAVFFVLLWLMGNVLLPFIVGGALAYFLDPVADRLERLGLSRVAATAMITVIAILIVVLLVLSIIPSLISQLTALVSTADPGADRIGHSGAGGGAGKWAALIGVGHSECGDLYRGGAGGGVLPAA